VRHSGKSDRPHVPTRPPLPVETGAEPLTGWRAWTLVRSPKTGQYLLAPVTQHGSLWSAGVPTVARCNKSSGQAEVSPCQWCDCGLYALKPPISILDGPWYTPDIGVVGTVAMWGTVVEHRNGYRAEFAYPQRLALVCGACLHQRCYPERPVRLAVARGVIPASTIQVRCQVHEDWDAVQMETPPARAQSMLLAHYKVDLLGFQ
jgi:hypothetical protein